VVRISTWVGAGAVAAGVSAALIAGADVANADTGSGSDTGKSPGTSAGKAESAKPASKPDQKAKATKDRAPKDRPAKARVTKDEAASARTTSKDASDTVTPAKSTAAAPATPQRAQADLSPIDQLQSLVYDFIGVGVTAIAGPPVVPQGSTVTVKRTTLDITDDHTVPADWYFPEGDQAPDRMIYLQHGFLGVGAMYSYTAANLAERTNSVVVVPTISSNRYARDGFWLGDDQVYRATADLLLGDREALTASAASAGWFTRYGDDVALPDRFALVGHSLGAGVVSGTAGYYADAITASGAPNNLAGIITLDGAPPGTVLPDALDKLDALDTFTPFFELGAPKEARRVDAALNAHRPGLFNGVILANGKHLDSMEGGTPGIQFISHLYQGFPTAQNQAAAQTLIDGWAADILDGRIDPTTGRCTGDECSGIYAGIGQTIPLDTSAGPTSASVIGVPAPAPAKKFEPVAATAVTLPRWWITL
jgi:pimeloyl-ACP methyl ester carboxylesterase